MNLLFTLLLSLSLGCTVYAQCIVGDCHSGQGTYLFKNNAAKYSGTFVQGKPEGKGQCDYANGDQYIGSWAQGLFSGPGILTRKNGVVLEGFWEKGKLIHTELLPDNKKSASIKSIQTESTKGSTGKTWALVVGISSYDHMPALRYADDDAWLFYSNLISNSGAALDEGQVKILIDESATREKILDNLKTIAQKAGPEDLLLFYFSGHGYEGSFLPIDYDGFSNKLFHSEINTILAQTSARQKICIADACHSGSLFAAKGQQTNDFINMYSDFAGNDSGTALILSSKSKETSLESQGLRQGVFTYFLVKGLKGMADQDQDGIIRLQEIFDYIYGEVRTYTRNLQSPILEGNYDPNFPIRRVPTAAQ